MLGARIASLRKHRGLSQTELAERLRVSPSAVGMYEQDRREPSGETLVALAREFGITVDFLLTGEYRCAQDLTVMSTLLLNRCGEEAVWFSREELAVLLILKLMNEHPA